MRIIHVSMNRAQSRINFYFLGGPSGNVNKMDGSSVLLDLRSVITMLTAQRSAGSHQPSISDAMRCQLMTYLQTDSLSVAVACVQTRLVYFTGE